MLVFILLSIVLFLVSVVFYCRYKQVKNELYSLKKLITRSFVKNDYTLQNAVLKAYETANAEHKMFEAREYKKLLDTLKGRN